METIWSSIGQWELLKHEVKIFQVDLALKWCQHKNGWTLHGPVEILYDMDRWYDGMKMMLDGIVWYSMVQGNSSEYPEVAKGT